MPFVLRPTRRWVVVSGFPSGTSCRPQARSAASPTTGGMSWNSRLDSAAVWVWPMPFRQPGGRRLPKPSRIANWIALVFVTLLLPWANYVNAFESEKLMRLANGLGIEDAGAIRLSISRRWGCVILTVVAIGACINWKWHEKRNDQSLLRLGSFVLFAYTLYYVVFGFIVKGFFYRGLSIGSSDTMYLPVLLMAAVVWLLSGRGKVEAISTQDVRSLGSGFVALVATVVASIVMFAAATRDDTRRQDQLSRTIPDTRGGS